MNREKLAWAALSATTLLAAGCAIRKDSRQTREQAAITLQGMRKDSSRGLSTAWATSGLRMRIDEKSIEKDTAGRIVRQIRRQYTIERQDSAESIAFTHRIAQETNCETETTLREKDTESRRKPAVMQWCAGLLVVLALLSAVFGLLRGLRKK